MNPNKFDMDRNEFGTMQHCLELIRNEIEISPKFNSISDSTQFNQT